MKTLLIILCFMCSKIVFAQHSSDLKGIAAQYLDEKGIVTNKLSLMKEDERQNLIVYGTKNCFVVMAKQDCRDVLNNPILAFSGESSYPKDSHHHKLLLDSYNEELGKLMDKSKTQFSYPDSMKKAPGRTGILLKNINHNQSRFERQIENHKAFSVLSGCGPCAMSQIIEYYKFPREINDSVAYMNPKTKAVYSRMLTDMPRFDDNRPLDILGIKRLQLLCSYSTQVDFGEEGTGSYMHLVKEALVNHFGYSPRMNLGPDKNMDKFIALYESIDKKQPVVMFALGHAFLCDGYDKEFFHLNMGWGGHGNGYYRLAISKIDNALTTQFYNFLLDVCPDTLGVIKQSCEVTKASHLKDLIRNDKMYLISDLTITGTMNIADLLFLRDMCWRGRLRNLDISDVHFATNQPSAVDPYCLPEKAFSYCTSLQNVTLPKDLLLIGKQSFDGCTGLRSIHIPATVRYVDISAFRNTSRLRKVEYHKDYTKFLVGTTIEESVFYGSSPGLQFLEY